MKKQILIFLFAIAITGTMFGQKTTHGNCRFHVDAYYTHGLIQVAITNNTDDCHTTYGILFPDGFSLRESVVIYPGKTWYYNHFTPVSHGSVIVQANNMYPANCPFEPAIVNL